MKAVYANRFMASFPLARCTQQALAFILLDLTDVELPELLIHIAVSLCPKLLTLAWR